MEPEFEEIIDHMDGLPNFQVNDSSFNMGVCENKQLFRQIRMKLIMNVHKVTEDVAVMMMKANDMPKKRGE